MNTCPCYQCGSYAYPTMQPSDVCSREMPGTLCEPRAHHRFCPERWHNPFEIKPQGRYGKNVPGKEKMIIKRLRITAEVLPRLGTGRFEVIANKLPADVEVVGAHFDQSRGGLEIVLHLTSNEWMEGDGEELTPPTIRNADVLSVIQ